MSRRPFKIYRGLIPLAYLYGLGVSLRNRLFDHGILTSRSFPLPVICIGNISVGGTGKTPHTEYLIRLLRKSFRIAVLSRGYKRKSKGFVLAQPDTPIEAIGDEPFQMSRKFPDICVAVDSDRCHGIRQLTDDHTVSGVEVILLDDAFQHRYVNPGLNILLIDYHRPIYQDMLLPAGRLREAPSGKERADILIVSKCPPDLDAESRQRFRNELSPLSHQSLYFTTLAYGKLRPLFTHTPERTLEELAPDEHLLVVTGIASPAPLLEELSRHTRHVYPLTFGDHHNFNGTDLRRIEETFLHLPGMRKSIVTTEKDAARLIAHPQLSESLKPYFHVLPVEVRFLNHEEESFNHQIIAYVRKNSRNSRLSEG